jgi:hypothetical protein
MPRRDRLHEPGEDRQASLSVISNSSIWDSRPRAIRAMTSNDGLASMDHVGAVSMGLAKRSGEYECVRGTAHSAADLTRDHADGVCPIH